MAHNPQYDVMFLYEQFIGPLPSSFIEFCKEWKQNFDAIYDTKAVFYEITRDVGRNKSALEDIFRKVRTDKKYNNNVAIKLDVRAEQAFGNYIDREKAHDAGYDAYMTGYVFATLAKKLEIENLAAQCKVAAKSEDDQRLSRQGKASASEPVKRSPASSTLLSSSHRPNKVAAHSATATPVHKDSGKLGEVQFSGLQNRAINF